MKTLTKNIIIGGIIVAAIVGAVIIWIFFGQNTPPKLLSVAVQNGNITSTVNLNGQVKASQGVDLAFESSGKVIANYVKVGDKIYPGQPLVAIDSSLLQAQLQQAQAQLNTLNIGNVENTTNASLQSLYSNSIVDAQKSVSTAKNIILTVSDIQYNHFTNQVQQNIDLQTTKAKAVNDLLGQGQAGQWTSQAIAQLNGGAFGQVQAAVANPTQDNIDAALAATQVALQDVNTLVNAVPIDPSLTATERASLSAAQTSINAEIITTSANVQSIASTKVNTSATLTTTNAQIQAAQASVNAIKTQIAKTVLYALFSGQVDKDNTVIGQIVSPNIPVVTISNSNLEIDTNISEIDIANAKIGENANVTLDAFGNNVVFPATVISIDTAPSIVNGVSVYGAKLKFNNQDSRIKTGMTANVTLIADTHNNVLVIPKSAVIQKDGKDFVIVDQGNRKDLAQQITVGISDSKNIEVLSGLSLGQKVLAY